MKYDPARDSQPRPVDSQDVQGLAEGLARLLTVEELDTDLYRGPRNPGGKGRVFGGQVVGQALRSAAASVDPDRVAHSLHAYFMRAGNEDYPIIFRVERDFDGGSFSTRRVIAMQKGQPILNMAASFQRREEGLSHADTMPDVPRPEALKSEAELAIEQKDTLPEAFFTMVTRPRPIELKPVGPWAPGNPPKLEPVRHIWFRVRGDMGDDPLLHQAALAYASDMALLGTSMQPHGVSWVSPGLQSASLDHAVWFHGDVRMDEWLLYATDSPWAGGGRGFNRGRLFTRDGRLVASTAQEGLIRIRDKR
ncbi:MAG: acyl-CoA thioesterase II TesB [Oceanicaulis sp. HLUCCA04]|nr:MAG: acyl-CoA thioesterase II TesB [Oceanicaulis sp. HLUCCA04]